MSGNRSYDVFKIYLRRLNDALKMSYVPFSDIVLPRLDDISDNLLGETQYTS